MTMNENTDHYTITDSIYLLNLLSHLKFNRKFIKDQIKNPRKLLSDKKSKQTIQKKLSLHLVSTVADPDFILILFDFLTLAITSLASILIGSGLGFNCVFKNKFV